MPEINRVLPVEIERIKLDARTVRTIYQAEHSTCLVR